MNNMQTAIEMYKRNQEKIGNNLKDKDRFKPDDDFWGNFLQDCQNVRPFSDVYEVNVKERYILLDLLDDVGLYKITIEKIV